MSRVHMHFHGQLSKWKECRVPSFGVFMHLYINTYALRHVRALVFILDIQHHILQNHLLHIVYYITVYYTCIYRELLYNYMALV